MSYSICPNIKVCSLVNNMNLPIEKDTRDCYISTFCESRLENWYNCKRYRTLKAINFCPDFVLPDSKMSTEEIIDRFDQEQLL